MTNKLKQTVDEATNTQREEEDIVDEFFSENRFAALITPGETLCSTSADFSYVDTVKVYVYIPPVCVLFLINSQ